MQIIQGIRTLPPSAQPSVLTIGNFDGVHLGHQELIRRMTETAKAKGLWSVAMTFEPHPVKVLYPDRKLHRIFDVDDQARQLASLGVDLLVIEPFSREFSYLPPERFLLEWVYRPFQPAELIVGYDFSFGANRQGSIDFLREKARELGFDVVVVPPVKVGDVVVSSSRIRQALEAGDVQLAEKLLGRPFYVSGLIEKGAGRGRTIGVPTANLRTTAETIPARGVYAGFAETGGRRWKAAVNIGLNPTFVNDSDQVMSVEAHLLDYTGEDIYGEQMKIEFVARLRDEKKFASATELVQQIRRDIDECSRRLASQ